MHNRIFKIPRLFFDLPAKISIMILLSFAFLTRLCYWFAIKGPKYGEDSNRYLEYAKIFARYSIEEVFGSGNPHQIYPLHQLYPFFLSPIYIFNISEGLYIKVFHIIFSMLTVFLLYYAGRSLISHRYGIVVGLLAIFYPSFLFWLPYVLTETFFLFILALFIVSFILLLNKKAFLHIIIFLAASVLLLIARPISVPILIISYCAIGISIVFSKYRLIFIKALIAIIAVGCIFLVTHRSVFLKLLEYPTFVDNYYFSTKISTSSIDEGRRVWDEIRKITINIPNNELNSYKVKEATRFIITHPFEYLKMSGKRFISFWYPWVFAIHWSLSHLLFDIFLSVIITGSAILVLLNRQKRSLVIVSLILMAFSLSLLSAFSQVDTEARFRLPAELILVIFIPLSAQILLNKYIKPPSDKIAPQKALSTKSK